MQGVCSTPGLYLLDTSGTRTPPQSVPTGSVSRHQYMFLRGQHHPQLRITVEEECSRNWKSHGERFASRRPLAVKLTITTHTHLDRGQGKAMALNVEIFRRITSFKKGKKKQLQALGRQGTMQNKEKEDYPKDPTNNLRQDAEENFQQFFSVLTRAQRSGIHEISRKP